MSYVTFVLLIISTFLSFSPVHAIEPAKPVTCDDLILPGTETGGGSFDRSVQDTTQFTSEYSQYRNVSEEEIARYVQGNVSPPAGTRYYVVRNFQMKKNNSDPEYGFERSSAFTSSYNRRLKEALSVWAAKCHEQIRIVYFEEGNRFEYRIEPVGSQKLPATTDQEMGDIYHRVTIAHSEFLKKNALVRSGDTPQDWYKFGAGDSQHKANYAARSNREFKNQMAVFSFESKTTQDHFTALFLEGQKLHREMIEKYGQTELFDQVSGRIKSEVVDLVLKGKDNPQGLIKSLARFYKFTGLTAKRLAVVRHLDAYIEMARQFSVESYSLRDRVKIRNRNSWVSGADISAQNGRNLSEYTSVFGVADFDHALDAAVAAEKRASDKLNSIVAELTTRRSRILRAHGFAGISTGRAGDEILLEAAPTEGGPGANIPVDVLREILNATDELERYRDAFVPPLVKIKKGETVTEIRDQLRLVDYSHSLEKELRLKLNEISEVYAGRIFLIRITEDGLIHLEMSHPPSATGAELESYLQYERTARRALSTIVAHQGTSSSMGLRMAPL